MVNMSTAKLTAITMVVGILAIAGTDLAFAQQPCGAQAYAFTACGPPLGTAQLYGAAIAGGVIVFSIGTSIASGNLRH
jgi:hypothetical protein